MLLGGIMARVPKEPYREERQPGRERDRLPVIKPAGHFVKPGVERPVTDRSPKSVTKINPEDMEPILPEMPYIPPA
jgi:hypothetical protein